MKRLGQGRLEDGDDGWRVVHKDGRSHKGRGDLEPLYNGDSVAHWEGDRLVIDRSLIDERTCINRGGGSTAMRCTSSAAPSSV